VGAKRAESRSVPESAVHPRARQRHAMCIANVQRHAMAIRHVTDVQCGVQCHIRPCAHMIGLHGGFVT
jgi:hypothetical protein